MDLSITKNSNSNIVLLVDNKSTLDLMKNLVFHGRSKHIDTRFHFIHDCVETGDVVVRHVDTNEQITDILKILMGIVKFESMRKLAGVEEIKAYELHGRI